MPLPSSPKRMVKPVTEKPMTLYQFCPSQVSVTLIKTMTKSNLERKGLLIILQFPGNSPSLKEVGAGAKAGQKHGQELKTEVMEKQQLWLPPQDLLKN